ncbi:MAG: helicase, partial [Propionibacterium sp.]
MDQVSATQEPTGADYLVTEIASEQAHLDRVYAQLERTQKTIQKQAEGARAILPTDRTYWFRPEDDGTAAFERDVFAYQAARRIAELEAHHEGLVFGRIDLVNNQLRHIGRIGVRTDDYEPLVLDWRAPAAEPFYRATSANPMDVVRRRVLRCDGPKVVGIEDDLLDSDADSDLVIVGEGSLLAALARARTSQMRDIVATIQAEQDEAIRAPLAGVTV